MTKNQVLVKLVRPDSFGSIDRLVEKAEGNVFLQTCEGLGDPVAYVVEIDATREKVLFGFLAAEKLVVNACSTSGVGYQREGAELDPKYVPGMETAEAVWRFYLRKSQN